MQASNLIASSIFLLFFLLTIVHCCYYAKFTKYHTMCKPLNKNCKVVRRGITEADKALIVRAHNEKRNKIAMGHEKQAGGMPPSANMLEVVWDEEIAAIAQRHAEQCDFEHDCNDCRRVDRFPVGQNLYWHKAAKINPAEWQESIDAYYSEVEYFYNSYMKPFQGSAKYGHFTQIVWATTFKVGCGWVIYEVKRDYFKYHMLLTCHYGPSGNWLKGEMYKSGNPCSACPRETCCGQLCEQMGKRSHYQGLCGYNEWEVDEHELLRQVADPYAMQFTGGSSPINCYPALILLISICILLWLR